jgi:hypothetical protein
MYIFSVPICPDLPIKSNILGKKNSTKSNHFRFRFFFVKNLANYREFFFNGSFPIASFELQAWIGFLYDRVGIVSIQ